MEARPAVPDHDAPELPDDIPRGAVVLCAAASSSSTRAAAACVGINQAEGETCADRRVGEQVRRGGGELVGELGERAARPGVDVDVRRQVVRSRAGELIGPGIGSLVRAARSKVKGGRATGLTCEMRPFGRRASGGTARTPRGLVQRGNPLCLAVQRCNRPQTDRMARWESEVLSYC